ncbi:unnamed protein product [Candidula unifasciata]|uniref:Large ribosomal subunit protein bL9m n=1 Tax=Candidula unifasciata TaxID=100452 RepID=A0A8S3YP28_9EUPU|nr:unnamed protein product [Candidula unifasciata]
MAATVRMVGSCVRCLRAPSQSLKQLCAASNTWKQQQRNHTIIMERVFPIPPGKDGGLPPESEMNELHKILRHVEIVAYPKEMSCILTDFVEGLGIRGDIVKVDRDVFHLELFPADLAVYASPENIQEFEEERKAKGIEKAESRLGVFARMTMKELNHMTLEIPMNPKTSWTLTKKHVLVAFRLQEVELDEDCIMLPEEPVTGFQDLTVEVVINKLETVKIQAKIVPVSDKYAFL